jgi:RNA polymerase sigma-70 factor, ECF subfamily
MSELGVSARLHEVNGQPGAVVLDSDGRVINVFSLEIADGAVQTVRSVINPDKLHHLGPVADVWAMLRGRRRQPDRPKP